MKTPYPLRLNANRWTALLAGLLGLVVVVSARAGIANRGFEDPKDTSWKKLPAKPPAGAAGPRIQKQPNGNHVAVLGADGVLPGVDGGSIRQTFSCGNSTNSDCTIQFEVNFVVPKGVAERAYVQVKNADGSTVTKQLAPGITGRHGISIQDCSPSTTIQFWIENDPKDAAGTQSTLILDNFSDSCLPVAIRDSQLTDPESKPTPPDEEWEPLADSLGNNVDPVDVSPPLQVDRAGDALQFSWPLTEEPMQLLATATLSEPAWGAINVPTKVAEGRLLCIVHPGTMAGPVFFALGKPDCDCQDLTLKSIGFDRNGASYESVNGGKTKVTLNFGVRATLTCDKAPKKGVCRGKVHWEEVAASDWGKTVQSTDSSTQGEMIVTAACDGDPHEVTADPFSFEAVVSAGRPVRGTVQLRLTTECPIGTIKDTRTISLVFDSTVNQDPKGIDRGASDLDGDGLTGTEEGRKGTDDQGYDTDGDGKNDKEDNFPRDPRKS